MNIKKPINELILFALFNLEKDKEKATFEKLIRECFSLFPKSFCFNNFFQWPDTRKLDRPLRTLRKMKLISGDPKTFFSLTTQGKKQAQEIAKIFRQKTLL